MHDPTINDPKMNDSCINYVSLCIPQTEKGNILYHTEKLENSTEQLKLGLILFP